MKKKKKESSALLGWRSKQKRGGIMKPATFDKIERSAIARGLTIEQAKREAGRAYWDTAKSKYKKSKKKTA